MLCVVQSMPCTVRCTTSVHFYESRPIVVPTPLAWQFRFKPKVNILIRSAALTPRMGDESRWVRERLEPKRALFVAEMLLSSTRGILPATEHYTTATHPMRPVDDSQLSGKALLNPKGGFLYLLPNLFTMTSEAARTSHANRWRRGLLCNQGNKLGNKQENSL